MVKYLVIRFSSIGDIVLTTPVVRTIHTQISDSVVHFLTKPSYSEILENNPYIQKVHTLQNPISTTIKELEEEQFDYIIDLQNNLKSLRIKRSLRKMYFTVKKLNIQKWIYVNFKLNRLPIKHIVDRYLETLVLFDVRNDQSGLDYFLTEKDLKSIDKLPENFKKGYVCVVIGANHETKKLTLPQLTQLTDKISLPTILIGGPDDQSNANEIIEKSTSKKLLNGCGKWSINESAAIIKEAKCVISHDTGMMHIAAAFKKDIIAVWGNTTPAFGMFAYQPGKNYVDFEVPNLRCRPCSKLGKKKCPKKHFKCMKRQDIGSIAEKANQWSKKQ